MPTLTVTIDATDPDALADFWAEALGYVRTGQVAQFRAIRPDGTATRGVLGPKLVFQGVPDRVPGQRNVVHLDIDLDPGAPLEPEVDRLVALGARTMGDPIEELGARWQVLADPEGNLFCVVSEPAGA